MSGKLEEIIIYICDNYPLPNELSQARLTKMIYLADWRSALIYNKQLTDINWLFNHFGPYVNDISQQAIESNFLNIKKTTNVYGKTKFIISNTDCCSYEYINEEEKDILDFIIDKTKGLYWSEFIELVYSTYPIATQNRYEYLNLVELANTLKKINNNS